MGETLAKPITEKHTSTFETALLRVGCCGMQGWRKNMEDAHVALLNLEGIAHHALFGVFDGHNGHAVARYCGAHVGDELLATPQYHAGDYAGAFVEAYRVLDEKVAASPELEGGSTAVAVLVARGRFVCANAGDSRAVLCRADGSVVPLSHDHKPTLPEEIARVERAGGQVFSGRVNGTLALTRAIGDHDFKDNAAPPWREQMVTALPDVTVVDQAAGDAFIVLACDGVWDVLSSEQCCRLVAQGLRETGDDVGLVCEMILDKCLAASAPGIGCDNMTIIIAQFKPAFFDASSPAAEAAAAAAKAPTA